MTSPTTARRPQEGELLYLDGFVYVLGPTEPALATATRAIHEIRLFRRPGIAELEAAKRAAKRAAAAGDPDAATLASAAAALEAEQAPLKGNYSYKKSGKCNDAELQWVSLTDLSDEIRTQSAALQRGNRNLVAWAAGAAKVQVDRLAAAEPDGFWVLPGRCLMKPPVVLAATPAGAAEAVIMPKTTAEAEQVAAAVLDHGFPYDRTKEN